jgi:hypothetical protein
VLFIESEPARATVRVDGAEVGESPVTLKDVAIGNHVLRATLEGYEPAERTVKVERAGERFNVLLTLKALDGDQPADAPPRPTDGPGKARGKLNLAATPWADVYFNGKKLGVTPLIDFSLPVGKHALKLRNPEKKISKTVNVEIKAGQTTSLRVKL